MRTKHAAALAGFWAVLWRSLVFMPYMLLIFFVIGGIWFIRWFLPFAAALFLLCGQWREAAFAAVGWAIAVVVYRRFKLGRFFEEPPSLL